MKRILILFSLFTVSSNVFCESQSNFKINNDKEVRFIQLWHDNWFQKLDKSEQNMFKHVLLCSYYILNLSNNSIKHNNGITQADINRINFVIANLEKEMGCKIYFDEYGELVFTDLNSVQIEKNVIFTQNFLKAIECLRNFKCDYKNETFPKNFDKKNHIQKTKEHKLYGLIAFTNKSYKVHPILFHNSLNIGYILDVLKYIVKNESK